MVISPRHIENYLLKNQNMKRFIKSIVLLIILFFLINCDNSNDLLNKYIQNGPIVYAAKIDSMRMQSGIYRARVNIYPAIDANRSHCILSWNITSGVRDSVRIDYTGDNYDPELGCYYTLIDFSSNQIQGNLLIEAQNIDIFGNRSLISDEGVYIYGSIYISTLTNASISFSSDFEEAYFENKIGAFGNFFSYELEDGSFTEEVFTTENSFLLTDAKYGGTVRVRTRYLLGANSIDTLTINDFSETLIPKERLIDREKIVALDVFNWMAQGANRNYETYGVDPITGIQNDGNTHNATTMSPQSLFNGNTTTNAFYGYKFIKTSGEIVQSFFLTFDLNHDLKLTRFKMFPRTANTYQYGNASVKRFRIWGTNDANSERYVKFPGDWTLIGEYESPDPVDLANLTAEERDYFLTRNEFRIMEDNVNPIANPHQSFRYMRLELVESYNPGALFYVINEIQLRGEIDNIY